jgi:glutathione peroxidase-family protein
MATYYAIPCPQELRQNFDLLVANFEKKAAQPQNELLINVANDYTDKIIEVMVLGNSQMMDQESFSAKVLNNVATVIKATAHTLIKQVLHKMKNEEMAPLTQQIRARKLVINGMDCISFPVPDH